jgi:hypothetical protein
MNIELRSDILYSALDIEDSLNEILKIRFDITKEKSNTLGNKSSNISFKTKVDFLYDLDILDKDKYNTLLMFGEIRNQFMHNIYADCFVYLFSETGLDSRQKAFLEINPKYKNLTKDERLSITEEFYLETYGLFIEVITDILTKVIGKVVKEKKQNDINLIIDINSRVMDDFMNSVSEIFGKALKLEPEVQEDLKNSLPLLYLASLGKVNEDIKTKDLPKSS